MVDNESIKILCVDPHPADIKALEQYFLRGHFPYQVVAVSSVSQAQEALEDFQFDLVILEYQLEDGTAFDLMRELSHLPVIFLVREGDETVTVRAMRAGALDYLVKDSERDYLAELPGAIAQALSIQQEEQEREKYQQQLEEIVSERAQALMDANQRLAAETEQRAQAVEDRRQTMLQQAAIDDLSATMAATMDLESIHASIQSHLRDLFEMEVLVLARFHAERERLQVRHHWGLSPNPADEPEGNLPSEKVLTRALSGAVSSGELANLERLGRDKLGEVEEDFALRWDFRPDLPGQMADDQPQSALVAPLTIEEDVIGVLYIQSPGLDIYDYRDAALFLRAANVIALGLHKAYLYERSERHIERLSSLHSIDQAMLSNLSLSTILDTLRYQLVALLGVDAVDILVYHPQLDVLRMITQFGFKTDPQSSTELRLGQDPGGRTAAEKEPIYLENLTAAEAAFQRSPDFDQEGFQTYYGFPMLAKNKVVGVLEIFHRGELELDQEDLEFLERLSGLGALAIEQRNLYQEVKRSNQELKQAHQAIIEGWAHALELRGIETEGHADRVVDLSVQLARRLGMGEDGVEDVRRGAYLHDIGKMGIPDEILLKKGTLTVEERKKIGQHPVYAYEMLKEIESLQGALDIPLYHHERWDGMGYPEGLRREEIPLAARIFAVVDVWDSLRSDRPYRKAWSRQEAEKHLVEDAGKHFDPQIVEEFLAMVEK